MTATVYVCRCGRRFDYLSLLRLHEETECRLVSRPTLVMLDSDGERA